MASAAVVQITSVNPYAFVPRDGRGSASRYETRRRDRASWPPEETLWEQQRSEERGPLAQVLHGSLVCHLDDAFAELPDEQRRIARLALVEGLSHAEIAERLMARRRQTPSCSTEL